METNMRRDGFVVGLLALLCLAAGGCVSITDLDVRSGSPAGPEYTVTLRLRATESSDGEVRGTLAVRVPAPDWYLKSATYTGAHSGTLTRSTGIAGYFETTWDDAPLDATHSGGKQGHAWHAGYSEVISVAEGDTVDVTIVFDTRGAFDHAGIEGGSYSLDFVAGFTSATAPTDRSQNNDGRNWEAGGLVDPADGIRLDVPLTLVDCQTFLDVRPEHPYWTAVERLAADGIVNGYVVSGGMEYRPGNDLWRWQFAKMICGTLGWTVSESGTTTFKDMGPDNPTSLEPHDYVAAATAAEIIRGYGDNTFRPYMPISRAQAVTMVVRAWKRGAHPFSHPPDSFVGTLGDFSPAHAANMREAEYNGVLSLLEGFGPGWDPWRDMSRGEVAQVLYPFRRAVTGPHGG
jgi:hypothetical protein